MRIANDANSKKIHKFFGAGWLPMALILLDWSKVGRWQFLYLPYI
jgi:hypothetical protein